MDSAEFERVIDRDKYQVFLFKCPATLPFGFGCHPWFVVNKKGIVSRWEIFWRPEKMWKLRWGHLHKDFYTPVQGISKYVFFEEYLWGDGTLLGHVDGGEESLAQEMADLIESSPTEYPYCYTYSLTGPNSNTYAQWVINRFPDSNLSLPWNAFGKNFGLK